MHDLFSTKSGRNLKKVFRGIMMAQQSNPKVIATTFSKLIHLQNLKSSEEEKY